MQKLFTQPGDRIFEGHARDNAELAKAWVGSTLAYGVFSIGGIAGLQSGASLGDLVIAFVVAGIVCGLGFVLHELAHRFVARGYGSQAHFVANNGMLLLSIAVACAGYFIAAPGAVWHRGELTKRQGGLIALAGPVTNLALSALFFVVLSVLLVSGTLAAFPGWVGLLLYSGFTFNAWLGLFNMLPSGPFDGAKVLNWSPLVFGITVVVGLVLTFVLGNQTVLDRLFAFARGL